MNTYLENYSGDLFAAVKAIDAKEFEKVINLLTEAYHGDKQVFLMGNGGSAATANHFVCDFGKNAVQDPARRRFRMISLCDNIEKITAFGNDVDFSEIFRQQLINLLNPGDLLIAVSASGNSPDLVKACEYAREKGAKQIALAGFDGGKIKAFSDAALIAPLKSYEMIEDVHMILCHMITCYFKSHTGLLGV